MNEEGGNNTRKSTSVCGGYAWKEMHRDSNIYIECQCGGYAWKEMHRDSNI